MKINILILLTILCYSGYSQTTTINIPNTDGDIYKDASYTFTIEESGEFKIQCYNYNIEMAHISLHEYEGNIQDIDSVHIAFDKQKRFCALKLYSCEDKFKERVINIHDYTVDDFTNIEVISFGRWNYEKNIKKIKTISKTIKNLIESNEKCIVNKVTQISGGSMMMEESGIDILTLNGHHSQSSNVRDKIRSVIIESIDDKVLDSINLISLKLVFDNDNNMRVESLTFARTKYNLGTEIRKGVISSIEEIQNWKSSDEIRWFELELNYLFSTKNKDVKSAAIKVFSDVKSNSMTIKKSRDTYMSSLSKEQKDSISARKDSVHHKVFSQMLNGEIGSGNEIEDQVYNIVEQMPKEINPEVFEEVKTKLKQKYPNQEFDIRIQYIVGKTGDIRDIQVIKCGLAESYELCNFAKEIIESCGIKYTPGRQRGKIVSVKYSIPLKSE